MRAWLALVLLLASTLLAPCARADVSAVSRFAIVIGNNRSERGETPNLHYADDDAVATHELLREAGVDSTLLVSLDDDTRKLHPNLKSDGAPRLTELERAFAALSLRMRERIARGASAELLLFYSGHGDVDHGEGYVVMEDGRLTRSLLYGLLTRSSAAKNHVFVDACRSYFLAFEKGPGGERAPYAGSFIGEGVPAQLRNTGFVLSTSSDRESHEWERYQAGILSHELGSALRGAADANRDGRVSYAELGAFLSVANLSIPNAKFRPDFLVRPPDGDLHATVLGWSPARASLRLGARPLGHVYVETAQGERVLDVHAARGQALELYLPEERPLFVRSNDESAERMLASREVVDVSNLEASAPEIAQRGALHLAFERLFAAAFSAQNVSDFERSQAALATRMDARGAPADRGRASSSTRHVARVASASLTLGATAAGLTLNTLAAVSYFQGRSASQVEIVRLNQRIKTDNLASIACYAVASAAGLTWALLGSSASVSIEPVAENQGRTRGFSASLFGRF